MRLMSTLSFSLAALFAVSSAQADPITADELRGHVRFLASDLTEGRGTASKGGEIAMAYIAAQMEGMGLQPGAADGSWLQKFDLVGVTSEIPKEVKFTRGRESLALKNIEEFIGTAGVQKPEVKLSDAEVVFVGYGIQAPEYQWDDFKDADLKGKVLLMLNNDPENDPALFAGKTRLYYGRWRYKYEQAGKAGAAGAIIIHTEHSAGYPWQVVQSSWSGEEFYLPDDGSPKPLMTGWTTEDASKRLVQLAGMNLDELSAQAEKREFKPVPLGIKLSLNIKATLNRTQTANVIGKLVGGDPKLAREAVIYTAHHDHLGISASKAGEDPKKDRIYNGALDNASGVASLLAIARSMSEQPRRKGAPRRTVYFAAVGAEEQGLLGSQYLAAHPPVPAGRIAANINMDGMSIWGRTRDLTVIGLGKSTLDKFILDLARAQKRTVVADQFPDKGSYYRSDQFSFARIGVPGAYVKGGTDVIGKPAGWGTEQQEAFVKTDYHQPSDELRDHWDFSGAVQDASLLLNLGLRVANAKDLQQWVADDEFEAIRQKAIADAAELLVTGQ